MRYTFVTILLIHGLIHLMGFIKAFWSTEISKQVLGISKPIGAVWLVVFILFMVSASSFVKNKKWFYIAFIAVIISQILIITVWDNAKLGTFPNFIILLVSIVAFSNYSFQNKIEKEVVILMNTPTLRPKIASKQKLQHLPHIVQAWLKHSGVIGKEIPTTLCLMQKGEMRTKPDGKWLPFIATQYFNLENTSFIWNTTVDVMPLIKMVGRDKLTNGEGEMLIKLAALIPVVNESKNEKINSGTMLRFLSELSWMPSAILNNYISWRDVDETSAEATFMHNGKAVYGIFTFTEKGELISFEAERYYGRGKDAKLEKWLVETISFKEFNGVTIPSKNKVTWKLKEGDFHWLTVEITDITRY